MKKAIQIFDVNRDLLEAWGVTEELTWANSFKHLIGSALVVDDELPQGYAVMTASEFVAKYVWTSNFGTLGWSDIDLYTHSTVAVEPDYIFILWNMNADSWSGGRSMKTIHKTLEGAIAEIPDNIRQDSLKRDQDDDYVVNYTYMAVEKRYLKD
jgi:hypothetical protein